MPAKTPAERTLIARIAAAERWSQVSDRQAATVAARAGQDNRWNRLVDPDGQLDPAERARRADLLRRAHMSRMALRSVQARRAKAGG